MRSTHTVLAERRFARGLTLIELMVAMAIGAFLMIGAVTVFTQSRTTFRINQSISRLQENARFALATIEPDIRMAGFYGLVARGVLIQGRAKTSVPNVAPNPSPGCGPNWAIDLENPVAGTNNAYSWVCAADATDGGYQAGTDTIVIRRVAESPLTTALANNTLYLQSARTQGQIFKAATVPAGYSATSSQTFVLYARGYYIAKGSNQSLGNTKGAGIPSLHRKILVAGPAFQDQELLAGVEDLQIELGVDTDVPGAPNRGSVDRYVNADDPIFDPASASYNSNAVILAVRIWLRLRAEDIENGFSDTTEYVYANVDYTPTAAQQPYRRMLVSKTIYLRNLRPAS
jgi:type IV pilus assembly protein PilW